MLTLNKHFLFYLITLFNNAIPMQNDIFIRRVANLFGFPNKTVKLSKYLTNEIKTHYLADKLGPIDYIIIPTRTNLDQEDYVPFLAFKNREVHEDCLKNLENH